MLTPAQLAKIEHMMTVIAALPPGNHEAGDRTAFLYDGKRFAVLKMVIDSSAIAAILFAEPEARAFLAEIAAAGICRC